MAHTFNDLAKTAGLSPAQLQALETAGVQTQVMKTCVKFLKGGEVITSVPVSATTQEALADGTAGPMSVKAFQKNITAALALVEAASAKTPSPLHGDVDLIEGDPVFASPLKAKVAEALKQGEIGKGEWGDADSGVIPVSEITAAQVSELSLSGGVYPVSQMQTGTRVPLTEATKLYQPVLATDKSSRYFCVAAGPEMRVGARYLHDKLSVRFEGQMPKYNAQLAKMGVNAGSSYASLHLHAGDEVEAAKALGALLVSLGAGFTTPLPNISILKGKGQ